MNFQSKGYNQVTRNRTRSNVLGSNELYVVQQKLR